jgi:hypothetical protein
MKAIRMLPLARTAAAIITTTALAVLATACGGHAPAPGSNPRGSASSANAGSSVNSQLVAFSHCVRSRGVPTFPDPQPGADNAKFPSAQQLGVGSSTLNAAENACQHLLPVGVDDQFPAAEVPLLLRGMRRFSQCMRAHGVPNWPDPSTDAEGRPFFDISGHGFSLRQAHSPQLGAKEAACQHLLPHALGGLPEG